MTDPRATASTYKYPRLHLMLAILASTVLVVALTILPSPDATATRTVRLAQPLATENQPLEAVLDIIEDKEDSLEKLAMDDGSEEPVSDALVEEQTSQIEWQAAEVKKGDTLSHLFNRVGLGQKELQGILSAKGDTSELKKIHPGQQMRFGTENGELTSFEYVFSRLGTLSINKEGDVFVAKVQQQELMPFTSFAEGKIQSSFFVAAKKAGLSNSMTMELANIFGYDVDFALDIRKNDTFRVIYQEMRLDGEKVHDGDILAAQFTNQGKTFTAIRFETSDRGFDYFTPEGLSLKKAFRRTPVDFARISSHFNMNRRHPVLHTLRAHKGTDYAAATGTPIKATGDGKVTFAGWKGGYGRVVILQHSQGISTLYGHMSGFGRSIRAGTRVSQGQVIGYVGSSGLATGPHVHYEFYVNGAVRNPVTVQLPKADPVTSKDKAAFLAMASQVQNQLATYSAAIQSEALAKAESE